jgi:hypothetical protein
VIYSDSRYSDATLVKSYNNATSSWEVTAFRTFPVTRASYFLYTWEENDRIDLISKKFLGTAALWWKVMDFNPEVPNPFNVAVGTQIRVPHVR